MCGDDNNNNNTRPSHGGALAILSFPSDGGIPGSSGSTTTRPPVMAGRLTFHSSSSSSIVVDDEARRHHHYHGLAELGTCVVGIHESGDLTTPATASPIMHESTMMTTCCSGGGDCSSTGSLRDDGSGRRGAMEVRFGRPLKIAVGGDGIIGRRVSMWTTSKMSRPVAEGIIGYN
ncbi:hypothetical protein GGR56DRAFT_134484 [Xylariaceae sp. FL0804]|nr:hypothetical protein GGR56DRAFT_134484 [Xylariaceae sp. FL0804]